jgi:hypothetical protein
METAKEAAEAEQWSAGTMEAAKETAGAAERLAGTPGAAEETAGVAEMARRNARNGNNWRQACPSCAIG